MMKIFSKQLNVKTGRRTESVDLTGQIEKVIDESGIKEGMITIFIPHTTCGVLVNENWDPTVQRDIHSALTEIAPEDKNYAHKEGNADSHIKTAIVGNSLTLPIENGKIPFGTWQGIFLMEFDGPRTRKVLIKVLGF